MLRSSRFVVPFVASLFALSASADTDRKFGVDITGQPVTRLGVTPAPGTDKKAEATTTESAPVAEETSLPRRELGSVFFETESADLRDEAQETLNEVTEWMKTHPNSEITVVGHADKPGTEAYNMALSQRRAEALSKFLDGQGVAISRIHIQARGENPGTERKATIFVGRQIAE